MDIPKLVNLFQQYGLKVEEVFRATDKSSTGRFAQWVVVHEHKPIVTNKGKDNEKHEGVGMTAALSTAIQEFQREQKAMSMIVKSTETISFMEEQLDAGEFERVYPKGNRA